jgi:hypothetical protein
MAQRDRRDPASLLPAWLTNEAEAISRERGVELGALWQEAERVAPAVSAAMEAPPSWLGTWGTNVWRFASESERQAALDHQHQGLGALEAAWLEAARGGEWPQAVEAETLTILPYPAWTAGSACESWRRPRPADGARPTSRRRPWSLPPCA